VRILVPIWILLAALLVGTVVDSAGGARTIADLSGRLHAPYASTVGPTITSHSPIIGSFGTKLKVMGTGLGDTSHAVFADDVAGTIVSKAAGEVDVIVPSKARNGNLTLTTPGGTASILFRAVPRVIYISSASHAVGSSLTINGSGLADVTSVSINSAHANFQVVSPNEISARIPTAADPIGSIQVSDAFNQQATYNFSVRPTISGLSPATAAAGSTIRISGTGFAPNIIVRFPGGSTGVVVDSSHTAIKVKVPTGATNGLITVTTQGGTSTSTVIFTFIASPDFSLAVAPASQTVSRGGQTTYKVYITPSHGFSGPVQLSLSGSPLGTGHRPFLVSTFSPNPVPAGGASSTLTVTVDARAERGTYVLTITGTSGSVSHTAQVSITVQ